MKLAVIGTFYGKREKTFALMHRLFVDATRKPDEAWLMCETYEDAQEIVSALRELQELESLERQPTTLRLEVLPTPTDGGRYVEIPYSRKINYALDRTEADLIVYLDNGSMPAPTKYELMAAALEAEPDHGAVYCTQQRTGYVTQLAVADAVVADGYCALNYTQVMHRLTADRWPLDMTYADPDLADGLFWRELHKSLGAFYPVAGDRILDDHRMNSAKAEGI